LDFSTSRLEEIANRIATMERIFNLSAGMNPEEDTLPERFSEESIQVEGKEMCIPKEAMEKMKIDYYQVRGWDKHGKPPQTLLNSLNRMG
jgi:aldehyde:ferredoxin oxidoreductase